MIAFTFSGSSLPSAAGAIAGRPDFSLQIQCCLPMNNFLIEMLERLDTKDTFIWTICFQYKRNIRFQQRLDKLLRL